MNAEGLPVKTGVQSIGFIDDKIHFLLILTAPEFKTFDIFPLPQQKETQVFKVTVTVKAVFDVAEIIEQCVAYPHVAEIAFGHPPQFLGFLGGKGLN